VILIPLTELVTDEVEPAALRAQIILLEILLLIPLEIYIPFTDELAPAAQKLWIKFCPIFIVVPEE